MNNEPDQSVKRLTNEQFQEYSSDPMGCDEKVRKWCGIPEDRYYTVSMWPEHLAGRVFVRMNEYRKVHTKKISKSQNLTNLNFGEVAGKAN